MYMASTTPPHFARSTANPAPTSPHRYPQYQRYGDGSSLSPPSRPEYHPYPPLAYSDYAPPLDSVSAFHSPRDHASSAARSGAEERERKRRISHSAMERRRRERTNNVIGELKDLIPWLRNEARMQKLEVLEQCVSYIKDLQQHQEPQSSLLAPAALSPSRKRRRTSSATTENEVTPAPDALDSPQGSVASSCPSPDTVSPHAASQTFNESSGSCNLPGLVMMPSGPSSLSSSSQTSSSFPISAIPRPQIKNSIGFLTS